MKFLIIPTINLTALGYDTTTFRKSNDGLYCILHLQFVTTIYPDIIGLPESVVLDHNSAELNAILNGTDWTVPEGVPSETPVQPNQTISARLDGIETQTITNTDAIQEILTAIEVPV